MIGSCEVDQMSPELRSMLSAGHGKEEEKEDPNSRARHGCRNAGHRALQRW